MSRPFFSVVVPSYLGDYSGNYGRSAGERLFKFRRALQSVRAQTETDWELIVVADGCEQTMGMAEEYVGWENPVWFYGIEKQRLWSECVRNFGIHKARGWFIVYLDTDDVWGDEHLSLIRGGLEAAGYPLWAIMDDQLWNTGLNRWETQHARLDNPKSMGTSNLVHQRGIYWPKIVYRHPSMGYDQDRQFVRYLKQLDGGQHIGSCQYRVCHIPGQYDI